MRPAPLSIYRGADADRVSVIMPASISNDELARMRTRYDAALDAARRANIGTALITRWHSETLLALDGQPVTVRIEMLRRMAIMLEVLVDRRGWLASIRGVRSAR